MEKVIVTLNVIELEQKVAPLAFVSPFGNNIMNFGTLQNVSGNVSGTWVQFDTDPLQTNAAFLFDDGLVNTQHLMPQVSFSNLVSHSGLGGFNFGSFGGFHW